ncbi:DNA helicase/exodeoxyribonuclease V, alpha subunit [Pseudonocardia thermophila]|uniref:RecBCD enzyme subunit RecD n=1 Tax=Pseudonocardia thermophila TaxID=1848 RepID=A0A1M6R9K0_PSETH|nr:exodeoxyribonuclease V subunit alpha [Pseudonocardia thermophila]SHK29153.1 DNA helicase/exodeoxyribonuclease V, alpha subunit [Pseudonocardia thermophila]
MTAALDVGDPRLAVGAGGLLAEFNRAGVLEPADVHVAARLGRLGGEERQEVLLAAALAVRAVRLSSVCLDLATADHTVLGEGDEVLDTSVLPWPEPAAWLAACRASPLVAVGADAPSGRPLRLVSTGAAHLLYLERYWHEEELVRTSLQERAAMEPPPVDLLALQAGLDRLFLEPDAVRQRQAAAVGVLRRVTVLAGGPGTGKTTTVARLLELLAEQPAVGRIALAAPTGKAAARLQEAVTEVLPPHLRSRVPEASTLHRLLRWHPALGFRHHRHHHLPYDVVVVDETSMVSLSMMARLLDAVRPAARLVLVGDPDQLASVEAGAVLGDLARAPGRPEPWLDARLAEMGVPGGVVHGVVTLEHVWRFGGAIAEFARAVRDGDADAAVDLLRRDDPALQLVMPPEEDPRAVDAVRADVVAAGRALMEAADAGDAPAAVAALDEHRVLCAHRRGPYGVSRWTAEIERWLAADQPHRPRGPWTPGRPVLVTSNDYDIGLFNGDTGVVVAGPDGPRVAFARGGAPQLYAPARLPEVTTVHAMTVHRGQGSQFRRVTVVLPPSESPLLTRELLYTAVTRARASVRIVGTEESVRAAVARPVARASGLRDRLA